MSVVIALILVAVLGILLGTGARPGALPQAARRDAARAAPGRGRRTRRGQGRRRSAQGRARAQIEAEEATARPASRSTRRWPRRVEDGPRATPTVEAARGTGQAPVPRPAGQGPHAARRVRRLDPGPGRRSTSETWDELEEALIRADVGIEPTTELLDQPAGPGQGRGRHRRRAAARALKAELKQRLSGFDRTLHLAEAAPTVWLFVGRQRRRQDHHHRQGRQARGRPTGARS